MSAQLQTARARKNGAELAARVIGVLLLAVATGLVVAAFVAGWSDHPRLSLQLYGAAVGALAGALMTLVRL